MNADLVVIGSLNTDWVATVPRFPGPGETVAGSDFRTFCGGKGANQAFAAGRLGARAAMVGQVGDDPNGTAQLTNLQSAGVDVSGVMRDPGQPTGTALIAVDSDRENRIIIIPGANGSFTPERLQSARGILSRARIVLLQLEIPMETVEEAARLAKEAGATVILDPAPASMLPADLWERVDWLTPNLSELSLLSGASLSAESSMEEVAEAARRLLERGSKRILVKWGGRGAVMIDAKEAIRLPAFSVVPVDTTAAGDCFNAAFACALIEGLPAREAGKFAAAAAACSVTKQGAQAGMPFRNEVEALMRQASI